MAVFCIDSPVFDRLTGVCFGAVVAKGIDNAAEKTEISQLLEQETLSARTRFEGANLKEHPAILPYRQAFQELGMNPNKYMCSVEALLKRVVKGASLPSINPIVDIGNAMSLKYGLPMGAHDVGKLSGDLEVRFTRPEDHFLPFGETQTEAPDFGEVVYASGSTIKTRRWIWRQSEDGKIDASSNHVVFPIDGFLDRNKDAVLAAQEELSLLLQNLFGCEVWTGLLTRDNPSVEL